MAQPSGAVAPDGGPVELYLLLPSFGEPEIIHAAIPDGASILEIRYARADWTGSTVTAVIEYRVGERRWTQRPFTAAGLDEPAVVASLGAAGLAFDGWLDDRRTWFAARGIA